MNLVLLAASPPYWKEIGEIAVPLFAIGGAIFGAFKIWDAITTWLDKRYITRADLERDYMRRSEFFKLLADSCRNEKHIGHLLRKFKNERHD